MCRSENACNSTELEASRAQAASLAEQLQVCVQRLGQLTQERDQWRQRYLNGQEIERLRQQVIAAKLELARQLEQLYQGMNSNPLHTSVETLLERAQLDSGHAELACNYTSARKGLDVAAYTLASKMGFSIQDFSFEQLVEIGEEKAV